MKIVDAYWEERNTGLRTCEITFNMDDTIRTYLDTFSEKDFSYIVARVLQQNVKLVHDLEETGFRFMETQFVISVSVNEIDRLKQKWGKIISKTTCEELKNKGDLEFLQVKINEGMFTRDRISLDETFGEKISMKRYINWISDIYNEGSARIFLIKINGSGAGFFVAKTLENHNWQALIAGIFTEYQGRGLPLALFYYYLKLASENNARNVITSFSSNNGRMLNSFTRIISFKVLDVVYVLRKTCPENKPE